MLLLLSTPVLNFSLHFHSVVMELHLLVPASMACAELDSSATIISVADLGMERIFVVSKYRFFHATVSFSWWCIVTYACFRALWFGFPLSMWFVLGMCPDGGNAVSSCFANGACGSGLYCLTSKNLCCKGKAPTEFNRPMPCECMNFEFRCWWKGWMWKRLKIGEISGALFWETSEWPPKEISNLWRWQWRKWKTMTFSYECATCVILHFRVLVATVRPIGSRCMLDGECVGHADGLSLCHAGVCQCSPIAYTQGIACVRRKHLSKLMDASKLGTTWKP